jgi:DNA-binding response OmpR family regulator
MLLSAKDLSPFAAVQNALPNLEFLVVCGDHSLFETLAAAIHQVNGRLRGTPHAQTAADYVLRRKVDGIVIDMSLPGALELIGRVRGSSANRFSVVFACLGLTPETQVAIRAGANFVLRRPFVPDRVANVFRAAAPTMAAEKRRYSRYPLMVPVELKIGERQVEGTMSNLSEGGMAIWSLYYHAPGSTVQFAFEIPFGGLIRGEGGVAWTNADGLAGIRFHALSDHARAHLAQWVARCQANQKVETQDNQESVAGH